ncbi:MAG: bactofilin family protein, partial [Methyloligellaceae bacterium]
MAPTVIGADFKITGHAVSNGEVQVDGEIEGDIECAALTVGETAKITGNVIAEDVTVQGKVMGSVRGSRVSLQSTSHMEGDVYHQQLA